MLVPVQRRERREIALDERTNRIGPKAAHQEEGEAARVGKAVAIERQRPARVDGVEQLRA